MLGAKTLSKKEICLPKPANLNAHKAMHQEWWMDWRKARNVETFNCDRGSQKDYKATLSADVSDWPQNMWAKTSSSNLKGLKPKANVGKEYYFNIEVLADESRGWHRFTGFSFGELQRQLLLK